MLLVNFFKETNMYQNNNKNDSSRDDQESSKFVKLTREFCNSVETFIKKVKETFEGQETQKIDNHINAMKSGKKSHAVEFQDKALNFLKDVYIFLCKAASFIIKAFLTLFDIVKPHAIKAFNKTKAFFKKAHQVLIQNENGMLHYNKEKQEQSVFRISGVVCSTIAVTTFALFAYGAFKAANTKIPLSEGYALLFVIACFTLGLASVFLKHSKENSMKVTAEVNINTSDEALTKILLNRIDELNIENKNQGELISDLLNANDELDATNQRLQEQFATLNTLPFDLEKANDTLLQKY